MGTVRVVRRHVVCSNREKVLGKSREKENPVELSALGVLAGVLWVGEPCTALGESTLLRLGGSAVNTGE